MKDTQLRSQIEFYREKLNKAIVTYNFDMTHKMVLKYSREMDKLIIKEMKGNVNA